MASRGINKVIIVGNLGRDPETKYMANGGAVTNLAVATSETWKDKVSGEAQEKTEWHRIVAFGKLAEIMGQYLKKGSKVYIEGKLQTRKWQAQDGSDRYSTEIVANDMQMLDAKGGGESAGRARDEWPAHDEPAPASSGRAASQDVGGGADFDEDIPF